MVNENMAKKLPTGQEIIEDLGLSRDRLARSAETLFAAMTHQKQYDKAKATLACVIEAGLWKTSPIIKVSYAVNPDIDPRLFAVVLKKESGSDRSRYFWYNDPKGGYAIHQS